MKPACAATKRSRASESSVTQTNHCPTGIPLIWKSPAKRSASTAFIVCPATGVTWSRR
jgi:hypothetical protein